MWDLTRCLASDHWSRAHKVAWCLQWRSEHIQREKMRPISKIAGPNGRPNLPVSQKPTCTFAQTATKAAAQGLGSCHTKEVIDLRGLVRHNRRETPTSERAGVLKENDSKKWSTSNDVKLENDRWSRMLSSQSTISFILLNDFISMEKGSWQGSVKARSGTWGLLSVSIKIQEQQLKFSELICSATGNKKLIQIIAFRSCG